MAHRCFFQLDPLVSGIGTGMSGLSIGSGAGSRISSATNVSSANNTTTVGGVFPLTGPMNAFANNPSSPAKMVFAGMGNSSSSSNTQSAFSSLLPPAIPIPTSQAPTQTTSSNLGMFCFDLHFFYVPLRGHATRLILEALSHTHFTTWVN